MPPAVVGIAAGVAASFAGAGLGLAIAIGVATVALSSVLKPEFNLDDVNPARDQTISTEANQPRKIIYGEAVVGGQIVGYVRRDQGDDQLDVMAIHVVGHPSESIELYEIEGQTLNEVSSHVTIQFHDGSQTATNSLANQYIGGWDESFVGFGLTNAFLQARLDPDVFPNAINEVKFLVRGKRIYDPRKDSTKGGLGVHRCDDETTWEWSDNPILCAYDYVRFHGHRPIPERRIPWDFVAATANYCDEMVRYTDDQGNQRFEKRFSCNGVLNNALRPGTGLDHILNTMGAKMYRPNGRIYIKPAMYLGPAVVTITPDDFADQPGFQPHRPEREKANTIRGEYIEPNLKYQLTDAPIVFDEQSRIDDGADLDQNLRLPLVNRVTQAQRLMRFKLLRNRAGFSIEAELMGLRVDVTPGSVVRYVDEQAGVDREFIVEDYRVNVERQVTNITLEEDHIDLYPDDFSDSDIDFPANTTLPDATVVKPVLNPVYNTDLNSTYRSGFLAWTHPVINSVVRYQVTITPGISSASDMYSVTANRFDIVGYQAGDYVASIVAFNRFSRRSESVELMFNVSNPVTSDDANVSTEPNVIVVRPTLPNRRDAFFEYVWTDDLEIHPDSQPLIQFFGPETGREIRLIGLLHDVVYNVFYRLVLAEGAGEWQRREIVGRGIQRGQLDPIIFEQIPTFEEIFNQLEGQINETHLDSFLSDQFGVAQRVAERTDDVTQAVQRLLENELNQIANNRELFDESGKTISERRELTNELANTNVRIVNETTARQSENAALVETIDMVSAQVNDNAASFSQSLFLLSEESQVLSQRITSLNSQIFGENGFSSGFISDLDSALAVDGLSITQRVSQIQSRVDETLDSGQVNVIIANILIGYYTQASTDEAIAQRVATLRAEIFNGSGFTSSFINDLDSALSVDGLSITQRVSQIQSRVDETLDSGQVNVIIANILTSYYTQASTDEAIAQRVATLRAEIFNGSGFTSSFINDLDSALSVDGLSITQRVSQIQSRVDETLDSEQVSSIVSSALTSYRTSASTDDAIAQAIDNISITANGKTASLTQIAEVAFNTSEGFNTQFGIVSRVEDLEGAFGLLNDGNRVSFALKVDQVSIIDPRTNSVNQLFSFIQNDLVIPDGFYVDNSYIRVANIREIVAGAIEADTVKANSRIESPEVVGGSFTGGDLTLQRGDYTLDITPGSNLPICYSLTVLPKISENATFGVSDTGRVYARDLTIRNRAGQIMMDTNGLDAAYINNLSVGTLDIDGNAVTVPLHMSSGEVFGTSVTIIDQSYNQSQSGSVLFSFAVECTRLGDVSGSADTVDIIVDIYSGGSIVETVRRDDITVDRPGSTGDAKFIWAINGLAFVSSSSVRVRVRGISNTSGQDVAFRAEGFVLSAKR